VLRRPIETTPVTGNLGTPWFRYSVEEIFRKAVIDGMDGKGRKTPDVHFERVWIRYARQLPLQDYEVGKALRNSPKEAASILRDATQLLYF